MTYRNFFYSFESLTNDMVKLALRRSMLCGLYVYACHLRKAQRMNFNGSKSHNHGGQLTSSLHEMTRHMQNN